MTLKSKISKNHLKKNLFITLDRLFKRNYIYILLSVLPPPKQIKFNLLFYIGIMVRQEINSSNNKKNHG